VTQLSCQGNEENYSQNNQSPSSDQNWELLECELRELITVTSHITLTVNCHINGCKWFQHWCMSLCISTVFG